MEYKILKSSDLQSLVDSVNQEIGNGWKPLGAPVVWPTAKWFTTKEVVQAMTRD